MSGLAHAGDPRLEPYARVGDPDWLRAAGLAVAEGRLLVRRALAGGRVAVLSVLVTPPARAALAPDLDPSPAEIIEVSPATMREVAGFNFHRGCLAMFRRPVPPPLARVAEDARVLVGLEAVGNPDNVGGVFRNAAAFGASGVLIGAATADPLYRKALRTSMGAALEVPWTPCDELAGALQSLRARGITSVAFTPAEAAMPLESLAARPPGRMVLLFGAEGEGLRPETMRAADLAVRIPIAAGVDSLNVAVAAGIALYRLAA